MRLLLAILIRCACLVTAPGARKWATELPLGAELVKGSNQEESVQSIADGLITRLVESGDSKILRRLSEALGDNGGVDNLAKRSQTINNGKLGHCCQAGKLVVSSYHDKHSTVVRVGRTRHVRYGYTSCGTWNWGRCSRSWTTYSTYYYTAGVILKIPVYTCGIQHAICCAGYVSIPKLPGGLAEFGEHNCIKSEKVALVVNQLQLIEDVAAMNVTADQMSNIFADVAQFFKENGIQQESK